jgi:hypothetical protein
MVLGYPGQSVHSLHNYFNSCIEESDKERERWYEIGEGACEQMVEVMKTVCMVEIHN